MSTTEIYAFGKDGYAYLYSETRNAWRGGMAIWQLLEERHLPVYVPEWVKKQYWYRPGMTREELKKHMGFSPTRCARDLGTKRDPLQDIWELQHDKNIPLHERICLYTTFDEALVKRENIPIVIDAFRKFGGETSLPEQADILEKMLSEPDIIAVGWNQTSVSADSWDTLGEYDEENDENKPYNCLTGKEHFWVFDELEQEEKNENH